MKTTLLILTGESSQTKVVIEQFSMLEPSASHVRFKIADGAVMESHGQMISYSGCSPDELPNCPKS